MPKHRTQLLLEPAQYEALNLLAEKQKRSISDLVREFVDWGLERLRDERRDRLVALDELDARRRRLEKKVGRYDGNLVAEVRRERDEQIGAVLSLERDA